MREAYPHDGAEIDRHPVISHKGTVLSQMRPRRHLHPAVIDHDPERRQRRSDRDHYAGDEVEPPRYALATEEKHAEETRFEGEGGKTLIGEQRSLNRACEASELAPISTELEFHDDSG